MIRKTSIFTKDSLHELMPTSIMQWEDIQKNTFTNWVNEQLSTKGVVIHDVRTELAEHLWTLVEVIQRRSLVGTVNRVDNQYARLQNITVALDAISSDGVRIVNIGKLICRGNGTKKLLTRSSPYYLTCLIFIFDCH